MSEIKGQIMWNGDCLELMKNIPDGSVDMILCDPPYGTIKNMVLDGWRKDDTSWDDCLNHVEMINHCERVGKQGSHTILFAQDPYTFKLATDFHPNNPFCYRYTWNKGHFANPLGCKSFPLNYTEDILVFSKKYDRSFLNPNRQYSKILFNYINDSKQVIFEKTGSQGVCHFMRYDSMQFDICTRKNYEKLEEIYNLKKWVYYQEYEKLEEIQREFKRKFKRKFNMLNGETHKKNILDFKKEYKGFHPTQKPVALFEYLIRTYTNSGETVLDFTSGSGTTAIAAYRSGRKSICIEQDPVYYYASVARLAAEKLQLHQGKAQGYE